MSSAVRISSSTSSTRTGAARRPSAPVSSAGCIAGPGAAALAGSRRMAYGTTSSPKYAMPLKPLLAAKAGLDLLVQASSFARKQRHVKPPLEQGAMVRRTCPEEGGVFDEQ